MGKVSIARLLMHLLLASARGHLLSGRCTTATTTPNQTTKRDRDAVVFVMGHCNGMQLNWCSLLDKYRVAYVYDLLE